MSNQPPIVMESFGLKELHVEWKDSLGPGTVQESKLDFGFGLDQMPDPAVVRIGMTFSDLARSPEGKETYRLSAHVMGFFRLAPGLSDEEKGKLLLGNGLAMLYSSLRGALLPITGCFPPGFRYILPTVNLQEIVRQVESKRQKQPLRGAAIAEAPPASKGSRPKTRPRKRASKIESSKS